MLDFLKGAFIKKKEVAPEPDSEDEQQYIEYCKALEKTLRVLESHLHESDDPVEIAQNTMKTACEFYGADWCGILEVDLDLGIWTPSMWYNPAVTRPWNCWANLKPQSRCEPGYGLCRKMGQL